VLKRRIVDECGMDGHAVRDRLDGNSVEKCQFTGVCVEGRIDFDEVAQGHWRDL